MTNYILDLFTENKTALQEFLTKFYNATIKLDESKFEKTFENPIDMIEIISTLIDNNERYPARNLDIFR